MVATPIFGPFSVTRSTNLADNQLINLRPELVDDRDGKNVGGLYGTPGLDLLVTVGNGPINGEKSFQDGTLYVVSGQDVYTVTTGYVATFVQTISGSGGRVSMASSGDQIVIFTDTNGYAGPVGFPFTGGHILAGGANYAIGDQVVMVGSSGKQTASVIIEITNVAAGVVTNFTTLQVGAFNPPPATLVQRTTTGSGSGLVLDTLTFGATPQLSPIFLPFTPIGGGFTIPITYQDGFAILAEPGTQNIWQSEVLDLSVYPPLNFATASGESDNVVSVFSIHRQVFVVKERSTEVWNNAGTAGFAFQPLTAAMIEQGTVHWATIAKGGESLFWLSRSGQGQGVVVQLDGFAPRRASTHAIETLIAEASTLDDAFGYAYMQEGHQLYVLTLPTANLTLVYDATDSRLANEPIWYQWLFFTNGTFARHLGNSYAFFNETPVLGDYRNGNLYRINLDTLTDAGSPRKWVRSWRAVAQPSMQPRRFTSLQVDMQTGIGIDPNANPLVMLRWSDDGGHNFSNQMIRAVGRMGQTALRVKFNRLGATRRNSGLDRIFELSSADAFPVCIVGAEIDV